jgi:D-alanyl-D-alanine carboxypeptidase/D-alanyl-D-alanine-endopeptidase (penicillin-binding protein 4)
VRRLPVRTRRGGMLAALVFMLCLATGCTQASKDVAGAPSITTPTLTPVPSPRGTPTPSPEPSFQVGTDPIQAPWSDAIDATIDGRDVSVAVGLGNRIVYTHLGQEPRVLASNEKLLTSMAALDRLGPSFRYRTSAAADERPRAGVVHGDLWLIGGGDPTLTPSDLSTLAERLRRAGIRRVTGDVIGDTAAFDRGWWAPGWLPKISREYVVRPTALRLVGEDSKPEIGAATVFRTALRGAGIEVDGDGSATAAPHGLRTLAAIASPPMSQLLVEQNHESDNLYAELATKVLGERIGDAASTTWGARVIQRWARHIGSDSTVRDGSGLSDQDRTSADGMVTMLLNARRARWFQALYRSLPAGGEGTLSTRLAGVPVRAKTGTLFIRPASTLSGYVRTQAGTLVAFSVLTHDLPESTAVAIEDGVVRTLAASSIR